MVFMEHGLMVGMWMVSATLSGIALWRSGALRHLYGIPVLPMVGVLFLTALLCKSTGAIAILFDRARGLGRRVLPPRQRRPSRDCLRIGRLHPAPRDGAVVRGPVDRLRRRHRGRGTRGLLETRIRNENLLAARAQEHWVFGWGGWNRSRITDAAGRDISITDSQWIITFGVTGMVGLAGLFGSPPAADAHPVVARPSATWGHPAIASYAVAALLAYG